MTNKRKSPRMTAVLDTNILLEDVGIFSCAHTDFVIPVFVLEELDNLKQDKSRPEAAFKARRAIRTLELIREDRVLSEAVPLPNNSTLLVSTNHVDLQGTLGLHNSQDMRIIGTALALKRKNVVLYSNDVNVRLRAASLGLKSLKWEHKSQHNSEDEVGHVEVVVDGNLINTIHKEGIVEVADIDQIIHDRGFITFVNELNENNTALTMRVGTNVIKIDKKEAYGLKPRNREQTLAMHALLDDTISLVSLSGRAGSGKTILAVAAGLQLVKNKQYEKLVIARPIVSMGNELGFLPGRAEDKLDPWMAPIYDAIEVLVGKDMFRTKPHEQLIDAGMLELQSLEHIRGRSMHRQILLIDESQNLSAHEAKTILTRAGEGTKIILTGDPDQIDSPKLDRENNGLTHVIRAFKDSNIATHLTLVTCERSKLADEASKLM